MRKLYLIQFSAAWCLAASVAAGETWEGQKLKPVAPEAVYEFTKPPTFTRARAADGSVIKDRYEITFASKGFCDVAVAIEETTTDRPTSSIRNPQPAQARPRPGSAIRSSAISSTASSARTHRSL